MKDIEWCTLDGRPSSESIQEPLSTIDLVKDGKMKASANNVIFRNPDCFVAGELHHHFDAWDTILDGYYKKDEILRYISEGVSIFPFFRYFKGDFKGNHFNSPTPPRMIFENSKICHQYQDFISETILERICNGSISVWGKEGTCEPPHLVMPLTIETSKPRMCHDERFLNLWMDTPHFALDTITDIPRYVEHEHFQSKLDDKSGYDHVRLTQESRKYFGFYWQGWYFVYNTLPFGWSPSAYIYQTIGLGATNFIRSKGVPLLQYIDDRHIGQLYPHDVCSFRSWSNFDLANAGVFITALVLVSCGYFIGIKKSVLSPTKEISFLGFIVDSSKQAFRLSEDKRRKFARLRDQLLQSRSVSVKSLQRFTGKVISFTLAVPAARLYTREVNSSISKGLKSSKPVPMTRNLREELEHWKFLDSWNGFLPWRDERHCIVKIVSDASNYGWGGIINLPSGTIETKDYWDPEDLESTTIAVKEAKALAKTLTVFGKEICNKRVDALVDNQNVVDFWNNMGGRNIALTNEIKGLFELTTRLNIALHVSYLPTELNSADSPSRHTSDTDCATSCSAWRTIERAFGPHTFDLMAIPSNVKEGKDGKPLNFFSPYPCAGSSGVNVFAQILTPAENYYAFPPFVLIGPLIRFLKSQNTQVTLVVPDIAPRKYWWPIVNSLSIAKIKIGCKSERDVLQFPPKPKLNWHTRPLQWDLYAFRLLFSS